MVVDDDRDLCENLWDVLHEQGYRVCVAHDELQAEGRLRERTYKVVLIDMKLSKEDGGQRVYEIVRQSNPAARVILITGFRTEMNRPVQRLVAEGADAVSYKPFDLPDLLATLKRLAS